MFDKFRQTSHLIALGGSVHIKSFYRHQGLRSLKTKSNKFVSGNSISLNLIVPPSKEPQIVAFPTTDELADFVKLHKGLLAVLDKDGTNSIVRRSQYSEVSPFTTYNIISPYFTSFEDKFRHHQVADKTFEDKSRDALVRYLKEKGYSFRELDRIIMVGKDTIAEWEGIFELENGETWFLECQHCVSMVFYRINLHLMLI